MFEDFEQEDKEVLSLIEEYEKKKSSFFSQEDFEQILSYYEEKSNFDKVFEVTNLAIEQYPFSVEFLLRKANILLIKGKKDEAILVLNKALKFDPLNIDIQVSMADAYLLKNEHAKAIEILESAMKFAPKEDLDYLYMELADVHDDRDDFFGAYDALTKVLEHNPQNPEALSRIWAAVEMTENFAESFQLHKKIIDQYPYNHLAWFNYAHACSGLGLLEKAVDAFEYAIAIEENFELAYRDCADAFFYLKKYDKAIAYYQKTMDLLEPLEELYYCIGICYEKKKDFFKARENYRKAARMNPDFAEVFYRIGETYFLEKKWLNAISAFQRAMKLDAKNIFYLTAYADANYQYSNIEEAISCYEEAVELNPNIKTNWITLANLYFENEDAEQAIAVMDEAKIKCSKAMEFGYYKTAFLYAVGKRNEAINVLQKALFKGYKKHKLLFKIIPNIQEDNMVMQMIKEFKK